MVSNEAGITALYVSIVRESLKRLYLQVFMKVNMLYWVSTIQDGMMSHM